ncbi:MAG: hypothetical protein JWR79_355 [Tardiphaga sp.]|nr:hypothetical protein [Tardiphaga sp.]
MLTRKPMACSLKHAALLTTAVAFAITMTQPSQAAAPLAKAPVAVSAQTGTSDVTDFSSQRRRYGRGGGYGGAAAAAAFAGIVGTAIIASQANRGYGYDYGSPYESYAYGGGPAYYGDGYDTGPAYYGRSYGYRHGNGNVPLYRGHPLASW